MLVLKNLFQKIEVRRRLYLKKEKNIFIYLRGRVKEIMNRGKSRGRGKLPAEKGA